MPKIPVSNHIKHTLFIYIFVYLFIVYLIMLSAAWMAGTAKSA
jgi:hypothetical protein